MSQPKSDITPEAILKAIEAGARSLTAVAKAVGYRSGSSNALKALLKVVPDVKDRLAACTPPNVAPAKAEKAPPKAAGSKKALKTDYPIPDCVPFRPGSYACAWAILYAHRKEGIRRADLVAKHSLMMNKPVRLSQFDVQVVCSPREDGSSNRAAARAAGSYWVERENEWLRMHLVAEERKATK